MASHTEDGGHKDNREYIVLHRLEPRRRCQQRTRHGLCEDRERSLLGPGNVRGRYRCSFVACQKGSVLCTSGREPQARINNQVSPCQYSVGIVLLRDARSI